MPDKAEDSTDSGLLWTVSPESPDASAKADRIGYGITAVSILDGNGNAVLNTGLHAHEFPVLRRLVECRNRIDGPEPRAANACECVLHRDHFGPLPLDRVLTTLGLDRNWTALVGCRRCAGTGRIPACAEREDGPHYHPLSYAEIIELKRKAAVYDRTAALADIVFDDSSEDQEDSVDIEFSENQMGKAGDLIAVAAAVIAETTESYCKALGLQFENSPSLAILRGTLRERGVIPNVEKS